MISSVVKTTTVSPISGERGHPDREGMHGQRRHRGAGALRAAIRVPVRSAEPALHRVQRAALFALGDGRSQSTLSDGPKVQVTPQRRAKEWHKSPHMFYTNNRLQAVVDCVVGAVFTTVGGLRMANRNPGIRRQHFPE